MGVIDSIHESAVHPRRIAVLAGHLQSIVPPDSSVLDVGCGDGALASLIAQGRPDIRVSGIDVLCRSDSRIPVRQFDGATVPFAADSQDVVMLIDVLHHTVDPNVLLREARRVARRVVVIKDHLRDGVLAGPTLRFMDWVGNARHGVALPYNYWTRAQWEAGFRDASLCVTSWTSDLRLYPWPLDWVFERSLHFLAVLRAS